ncbi:MAG: nuclear transport factor 2 family protein [Albidovulum sp.]|uniref:YybH family protein n=1 Tax=Albidovulum sp. TaxID=1872424 RepID=UPI003C93F12F
MKLQAQALFDRMASAYRAGDAAGCADCFTDGALLLSPYAPEARGRAAIEALHRDWTSDGGNSKTLTVIEAGCEGNTGWCLVDYSEGDMTGDGKSLGILRREPGGWRISHCCLVADDPPLAEE